MIYHYTSVDALAAILKSHSLHATDYRYLNDPLEGTLDYRKIATSLNSYQTTRHAKLTTVDCVWFEDFAKQLVEKAIFKGDLTAYVFSLTDNKYSAPAWLSYGDKGHGVCIQFPDDLSIQLFDRAKSESDYHSIRAGSVSYLPTGKVAFGWQIFWNTINNANELTEPTYQEDPWSPRTAINVLERVKQLAGGGSRLSLSMEVMDMLLFSKQDSWKSESEYRIVSRYYPSTSQHLIDPDFIRRTGRLYTPVQELIARNAHGRPALPTQIEPQYRIKLPIQKVIAGNSIPEIGLSYIRQLLVAQGYFNVPVERSDVAVLG